MLPVVPFGPTPEHRNFGAGYVDLPVSVHDAVARATPGSLAEQGFAAVVVWRGCGGHLRDVVFELRATWAGRTSFDLPDAPFAQLWAEFGDLTVAGGHADSFDVHLPVPPARGGSDGPPCPGPSASANWTDPALDFAVYTDEGTIGDARAASAERGRQLWGASVNWLVDRLLTVAAERGFSAPPATLARLRSPSNYWECAMRRSLVLFATLLALVLGTAGPAHAAATEKQPILFVHGYGSDASTWSTMAANFTAAGYTTDELFPISYSSEQTNATSPRSWPATSTTSAPRPAGRPSTSSPTRWAGCPPGTT